MMAKPQIVALYIGAELAAALERRFGGIQAAAGGEECLSCARDARVLLLDASLRPADCRTVLAELQRGEAAPLLSVICLLERGADHPAAETLRASAGRAIAILDPDNQDAILAATASAIQAEDEQRAAAAHDIASAASAIWEKFRPAILARIDTLEGAAVALLAGDLNPELRREAAGEAHKLAGSAGTFGFREGTRIAREIEQMLSSGRPLAQADARELSAAVLGLREVLEAPDGSSSAAGASPAMPPALLVVAPTAVAAEPFAAEARARGLHAEIAASLQEARAAVAGRRPQSVLLHLAGWPGSAEAALEFLGELGTSGDPTPAAVCGDGDDYASQVAAAAKGARVFLRAPVSPPAALDALARILEKGRGPQAEILAVDDDPAILESLKYLLGARGVRVIPVSDPLAFWRTLEANRARLLLLDMQMPGLSGEELCRIIRNDERWRHMPIVFVSAESTAESIQRAFAAGADDFIAKPIDGPELVSRVLSRLQRTEPGISGGPVLMNSASPQADVETGQTRCDIAVVDDDDMMAALLCDTLRGRGYRVERFSDGVSAVAALTGAPPKLFARLVLLDVNLPGLNGLDVLQRLGAQRILEKTRVIVLTARSKESEVLAAMDLGAFDHVAKPFGLRILMRRVERALES